MFIDSNNKRINIYASYTKNGITYPNLADSALRAKLGVTEIPDPERKSDKFYFVTEQNEAPYIINTPKNLDQVRPVLIQEVKNIRDGITSSGGCKLEVSTGVFKWFHTDAISKQQQLALVVLGANIPANLEWKTMDGSKVTMTQQLATSLFAAQVAREHTIFQVGESKIAEINNATFEELEVYDVRTGWPEVWTL